MIYETVITTRNTDGSAHIAPMGIRDLGAGIEIAPFRPSVTLDNLVRQREAVINLTDDVRIIAGCLTGRTDWPLTAVAGASTPRLAAALAHTVVDVVGVHEDPQRPRIQCAVRAGATHGPFRGYNRAQAAVVEAAILVSRLHLLPADKVDRELAYLQIAIDKTAGPREREAWTWLTERTRDFRAQQGHAA